MGFVRMRGRSLASSKSSSSPSSWEVLRLMQEQRSSDAKNAEATLFPTQFAILSSFSQFINPQLLCTVGFADILLL
ncbi:unnamed protein product [Coffea canephora]|uniref:Uncharacterized protein n=1 Tax=Coffea canephora TaxID=49390 RepID=A0A068UKB0_COFCA|nr:unnamed protein product [Coffea canephora]